MAGLHTETQAAAGFVDDDDAVLYPPLQYYLPYHFLPPTTLEACHFSPIPYYYPSCRSLLLYCYRILAVRQCDHLCPHNDWRRKMLVTP